MGDGVELRNRKYELNLLNGNGDVWIRGGFGYIKSLEIIDDGEKVEVIDRFRLSSGKKGFSCFVVFDGNFLTSFQFAVN